MSRFKEPWDRDREKVKKRKLYKRNKSACRKGKQNYLWRKRIYKKRKRI